MTPVAGVKAGSYIAHSHRKPSHPFRAFIPIPWCDVCQRLIVIFIFLPITQRLRPVFSDRNLDPLGSETLAQTGAFDDPWKFLRGEDLEDIAEGRGKHWSGACVE